MSYSIEITLPELELAQAIQAELLSNSRSTMTLDGKKLLVVAQDATALRAALSSVGRLIMVYEEAK